MMRTAIMFSRLLATGAAGTLAVMLTACGGGGSSATPAAQPAPQITPPPNTSQSVSNGPTGKMTISIKVPAKKQASSAIRAAMHKRLGQRSKNPMVRQMANTSPTATIRKLGEQLNSFAKAIELSGRRAPAYISPDTQYMEVVVSDTSNTNVLSDSTATCNVNACANTFDVAIGNNVNVTVYLYDFCGYLLSAGTIGPINITVGTNGGQTITLNPVVYAYVIGSDATQFYSDPAASQNFNLTLDAVDADNDYIAGNGSLGTLMDSSFNAITSVDLTTSAIDVTPALTNLTPQPPNNAFITTAMHFAGTGAETSIQFTTVTHSGLTPLVPNLSNYSFPRGTNEGYLSASVTTPELDWTNVNNYNGGTGGFPRFTFQSSGNPSSATIEFPVLNPPAIVLGLLENRSAFSGNITLSDAGTCTGIISFNSLPTAYSTIVGSNVTLTPNVLGAANSGCAITATDDAATPRQSTLYFTFTNTSLTIQNKARTNR
jgi:hypothetical protein